MGRGQTFHRLRTIVDGFCLPPSGFIW